MELKEMIKDIRDLSVVKSWLRDLSGHSRSSYIGALAEFCIVNNVTPDKMLEIIYKEEEGRIPAWERSVNKWFEVFDEHCREQERTKSTRNTRRTIVNGFIGFHGLPQYISKGVRRKFRGLKEPNKREMLKKDDIKELLNASKNWKMKAMILAQLSSGLTGVDMLNLKIKDFCNGLMESYDKDGVKRKVCMLHLFRKKTDKEYTTFFSEEAVLAIEKYLNLDRIDINDNEALFASYKSGGKHMTTTSLQMSYRYLNNYLGWKQKEKGRFRKATSHMMRKFFNTQLINAGLPEEIREHFMGHVLRDKVRDAYFLAEPKELLKIYLQYMDYVTIEKREVGNEEFVSDHGFNNAKINELESLIKEMKKKLDNVTQEAG